MSQEIDYAAVLADLEARKTALDAAIAAVRAILGQGSIEATPLVPGALAMTEKQSGPQDVTPGVFHGMSMSEAAKKYFQMTKTKHRTNDIARALQMGGIETTAKNFYAGVFTVLKRSKDFKKLGKFWTLAEWHPHVSTVPDKAVKRTRRVKKVEPTPRRANSKPLNLAASAPQSLSKTETA